MAAPLKAQMPPDLDIGQGYKIRFTAVSAATGSVVAGVTVSGASLLVESVGAGTVDQLAVGPFMLVPGPET